jgi:hypothetical protein
MSDETMRRDHAALTKFFALLHASADPTDPLYRGSQVGHAFAACAAMAGLARMTRGPLTSFHPNSHPLSDAGQRSLVIGRGLCVLEVESLSRIVLSHDEHGPAAPGTP